MKVKVFEFEVSNGASRLCDGDEGTNWAKKLEAKLFSPAMVSDVINDFVKDKDVVDIKVNNVDVQYHDNCRGNTVRLWYTILYR